MKRKDDQVEPIGADNLTDRQRAFCEEYLTTWNAAEAARRAGYSAASARSIGSENLTKPDIRAYIDRRMRELQLGEDTVLARLADIAFADMGDFIKITGRGFSYDLRGAKEAGKLHLIKKISKGKNGTTLELVDQLAALTLIGRHYKLFVDRAEVSGPDGKPMEIDASIEKALKKVYGKDDDPSE